MREGCAFFLPGVVFPSFFFPLFGLDHTHYAGLLAGLPDRRRMRMNFTSFRALARDRDGIGGGGGGVARC